MDKGLLGAVRKVGLDMRRVRGEYNQITLCEIPKELQFFKKKKKSTSYSLAVTSHSCHSLVLGNLDISYPDPDIHLKELCST